jgi:hypothetical protein
MPAHLHFNVVCVGDPELRVKGSQGGVSVALLSLIERKGRGRGVRVLVRGGGEGRRKHRRVRENGAGLRGR